MVITSWSAISPFGYGHQAFTAGLRDGVAAHRIPDFDIVERLGGKGTGSMDRSSALAVATAGLLLDGIVTDARTGVVLGTTSGSTATQFAFTRDSLTRRKPYFVNPAMMPFALMNSAAAQCAIWHGLTGPNATVANGRMSGLVALRYANRLLATGRATGVVCGAVEEYSEERALLEGGGPLGEGCALLFCAPAGSGAEVLAVDTRLALDGSPERALAESLASVLSGVDPGAVTVAACSSAAELAAVRAVVGPGVTMLNPAALLGDTGAVTAVLGVAALLGYPGLGVLTCADRDGLAGSAVLRMGGGDASE